MVSSMRIGILALQGAFIEHEKMLQNLGVETQQVRLSQHLNNLDGLIIPGGESTTIAKLAIDFGLFDDLKTFASEHPVWGTCAGAIFLSKDVRREQPLLELMDITVERNAFGRQVASFESDITVPALENIDPVNPPYHAIFIRAPLIETTAACRN